jgi:choline-sulfatase
VPTACDYAGIDPPPHQRGRSLRAAVEGDGPHRPFVVAEVNAAGAFSRMVRTSQYKYIAYKSDPAEQFFDMQADPGETRDLAGDGRAAAALAEHRRMLEEWERGLVPAPGVPKDRRWLNA